MGLWAPIKKSVNSNLELPLNELIGSSTDTASDTGTTLWSRLRYVVSQLTTVSSNVSSILGKSIISNGSAVKSVQRGVTSASATASATYITTRTITISSVSTSKSILLFTAVGQRAGSVENSNYFTETDYGGAYLGSSTTVLQYPESYYNGYYHYPALVWQVIEFY